MTATATGRHLMKGAYALDGVTTADEARAAAGLAWEPVHVPLYLDDADLCYGGAAGEYVMVEKERAVVRNDTGQMFGVVGREHQLLSNAEFFDFADVLLAEAGTTWAEASPVGGALGGGRQPFLVLQLPDAIQVAGVDAVNAAIMLSDGKVGNMSFIGNVNPIRVECSNQVASALRALGLARFSVQHSGDLAAKVAKAREGLAITSNYMKNFETMANRMAAIDFSLAEFDDFLGELLPLAEDAGDRARKTNADLRGTFRQGWLTTETLTDDLKRTVWGALNVVTEVLDHGDLDSRKSKTPAPERRMRSVHFGAGAALRNRAYDLLAA